MEWSFLNLFTDYTLRTITLGVGALGICSGVLGAFAVLRRQSLLGDAISHAALPGVVLAFLLTRSKVPFVLMIGAALTGWLATLWMTHIIKNSRIKEDSALGMVLSVFFGLGLVLLTLTQRIPDARQAGLDQFLFGQAAALLTRDVVTIAILGGLAVLLVVVFWKEFKLLSFDRDYGASLGFPVGWLDILLTSLLVIAIVIGLQTVGVVLMSSMLIAPAVAARQWTNRLGIMVLLSALFGALAGIGGTLVSSAAKGLSTGPTVVLAASLFVLISLLGAPNRGLLARWIRQQRSHRSIQLDAVLLDLYELARQHGDPHHPHKTSVLQAMSAFESASHPGVRSSGVKRSLAELAQRGWVRQEGENEWSLTPEGLKQVEQLAEKFGEKSAKPAGSQLEEV